MATVYLHIGAPKTAAPILQNLLAGHYEQLLARGVLYPRLLRHGDAHHTLVCDLIQTCQGHTMSDLWYGERSRGSAWRDLQREIERHRPRLDKIIISSELFFGQAKRLEEMLTDIRHWLSGHELKVVAYLRRQDQFYSTFFAQDVMGARQWAHNAYQYYQTQQIFQHDYDELLGIWCKGVGKENMLIRPYEDTQWAGGNIVEDFCSVTGIEPLQDIATTPGERLGPSQLYIKLCLNRVGFDKRENENLLGLLRQVCPEASDAHCIYVHRALYRNFRSNWIQVNKRLADEYLDGTPLFADPIPPPEKVLPYQPELPQILACLLALFEYFDKARQHPLCSLFARAMLLILAEKDLWDDFGSRRRDSLTQWL